MEPRIQYAKTRDGVTIAFCTLGEGMPLVYMPVIPDSHIQLEWQDPELRRWYERLMEKRKLVRYDSRGTGLSERNVTEYSVDSLILDLEAVVDRLGLERFALLACLYSGPVAIAYAARHPERVSHLLLTLTAARASEMLGPELSQVAGLIDKDWELFTETFAHVALGWSAGEPARRWAARCRESVTPQMLQLFLGAVREIDVTDLLPQVRSPTLVLHRRQGRLMDVNVARGLVSRIPDARLALLEGTSAAMFREDTEPFLTAVDEFLGEGEEAAAGPGEPGVFRTILFTDVVGHTEMMQRLGDQRGRDVLREHERTTRGVLGQHLGTEVKTMGDGFMASFSSVTKAVECAIALQRAFGERNQTAAEPLHIRVGLNAGEPIEEEGDLFGAMVILAARIAAKATADEILASLAVRELCAGKGFLFADRGEAPLRGFEDPVRLYEVRWRD
ncbi:MAG: hypothetical protein A2148_05745 [Chloroflexi bacterium RBG_16_68_14]|nr:MAG: hypothetical protein A2148_05745 [Chloroflexi bacterium RBG_16_68_14]